MRNETRKKFNAYLSKLASLNGVDDATKTFNVIPSVQQTMEKKIQESSEFLKRINMIGVTEQQGEKLGLSLSGPIASRTDTTSQAREPRDLTTLDKNGYYARQTNYDSFIPYAKLDAWAQFPEFQQLIRDMLLTRQALDRIMIGFNGRSIAATTNPETNPLLQDVNKGWLQKQRDSAPERVMDQGKAGGKIMVGGADADYKNIDAMVYDAINLLDPWHTENPRLVAILGRGLMHDKYFPLVNQDSKATDTLAADIIISQKRVGGLPAVQVPYFPANTVTITTLDNLSLYWQTGGRRRHVLENPARNRVDTFESSNDDYVVEDHGLMAVVENIQIAEA
ncbi:phage major capsid protein, P2 family [Achromobacter denitrificans]|uniref:phage major capsid protein, P2 family n=1 Tax=Achromobacter denitrificans TaxID=32002 RepID=UPI000F688A0F|nr:phage major capsid protein, P2 family [Achromobacter denitrificans]RSE76643.1 phage major capsid protein, P2 family [Achromobacter denitrificans]